MMVVGRLWRTRFAEGQDKEGKGMDVYDPQTLGFMVFGGFMVVSAIGIALVSTLSMKETSYEEALAKHRHELGKSAQTQLSMKNKKKKALENKSKAKKKEERPNGNLPEPVAESASEPEPEPLAAPEPEPEPEPIATPDPVMVACAAPVAVEAAAPSPKKKKKVAKVAPAPAKPTVVPETIAKEVPIMVVPPVAIEVAPVTAAPTPVSSDTPTAPVAKAEELKAEAPAKKKKSKAKAESVVAAVDSADAPLLLPYKTLLSTVSSMTFSEGEAQRLIEVLSDKAGLNSWQLASQKGDPTAALKKQLEEKEKQLSTEQEGVTAAKNRLRELTKELSAEKSKTAKVETRLSSELSAHTQEITALQARMQASYQDHVAETQQLNLKIVSLQEQLDNGPVAQLARLQQENSILRDALNQATSQAESRQNAELAKLRQDCVRLNRDLGERTEALQADDEHRKCLEAKVAASVEQLAQFKACQAESEQAWQQRLEEVSQKLQKSQDTINTMQAQLDQAQQEAKAFAELQERMATTEAKLKEHFAELEDLKAQQAVVSAPLESPIEPPPKEQETVTDGVTETPTATNGNNSAEVEELKNSLITKEGQVAVLEEELQQLKVELELVKSSQTEDPQVNGVKEEEAQSSVEEQLDNTAAIELLQNSLKEKESIVTSLEEQLQTLRAKMEVESPADTEQLQSSLKERESQVASLEEELKQLREEMEQGKSANAESGSETEAEQPFECLEKDSQMLSLEEELQRLKEEMEQVRNKSNDLREKNWAAMEALTAAEKLNEERLAVAKGAQRVAEEALSSFQTEAQKALQMICPDVSLGAEQNNWLELLIQKAQATEIPQSQEVQQENLQPTDSEELLSKLGEAEESQKTLQAECEQYRTVLAETEGMLKDLQKSVEEEEHVWKLKIVEAEEQGQAALDQVKVLQQAAEDMKMNNESTDQLKEQVMLLEAQLEKQLESISFSQTYAEEVAQLKALLTKTQSQLETAQLEAQKQAKELSVVRQQLSETTEHVQSQEASESTQVQTQLEQVTNKLQTEEEMRQQLAVDFDQAQKCVTDLQTQMDQMKAAGDCSTGELKERLEKEKKLTKDLGQAATKLQQLLKATQEQLVKERDTVKTLQGQLVGKEEPEQSKEGTSV
ncbi:ribosome-binding protein 1b isoform X2 [Salmo salar]|uniref:Ribosome-binding protein 1b isoform X2 n=1 Tax=Salmo salar TaxID=8030 RepID=A0A1S3L706_SALSA|nr:ribosome-binding protein 1b isoform X2 [Salmo salar]|eukprot:XP_013986600.1 PREDICTED: ribosome-binding protein 1 isoform X2 [Salmo salar]